MSIWFDNFLETVRVMEIIKHINKAPVAWNHLNGVINVYKPVGVKVAHVRNAILLNLCKNLNDLKVREPRERLCLEPGGDHNEVIRKTVNLADHVLAVGPRYQMSDIKCGSAAGMGIHSSGVLILGINSGIRKTTKMQYNKPIRTYHVTGRFGIAKENHFEDSRVTAKATYHHITADRFSALVSSMQASHQRKMFELCGVDLQSQAAYEIASQGAIRPANNTLPVIYSMKLIEFKRPFFTIEMHAINEDEDYLATLIHEIGIELKSVAFCTALRCLRHGHFSIEKSLLRRDWTLNGILSNMAICRQILIDHPSILRQQSTQLSSV